MTDIVERLRVDLDWPHGTNLMREAADEIERLRGVLRQIELNSREGEPLTLKLNWLSKQALK